MCAPGRSYCAPGRSHCAPGRSYCAPGRSHCAPGSSLVPGKVLLCLGRSQTLCPEIMLLLLLLLLLLLINHLLDSLSCKTLLFHMKTSTSIMQTGMLIIIIIQLILDSIALSLLTGGMPMAIVNCLQYPDVCEIFDINRYPTVMYRLARSMLLIY